MFRAATLRLAGWYLSILMIISIVFSIVIFNVATSEVETRLERFQNSIQQDRNILLPKKAAGSLKDEEIEQAQNNLSIELLYVNIFILVAGWFASYYLAKHHLKPIEKAHEAQSRFTSDASHELRTPLAVMKTELEVVLRDKNATPEELRQILSSNLEEVDKLAKLAEMLLNLSRLDSTKLKLSPINLNKIARGIIHDFGQPQSRINLISKKSLIVIGNEMAIADLIKILIDNALQYSPKESQINIQITKQPNQTAKFAITNIGDGIQPDKLLHIFDRFYRADSSRTGGENRGYGLGLDLAKKIIELHNGQLFASSTPGKATTFTFVLNLHSNAQAKIQE